MDIQLLMRIERMTQPRWLTLSADVAAAKRLVASGMIEVTLEVQCGPRVFATEAVHVHAITREGALAIASEKSCSRKKTVLPTP
ncbi:hypothetical protein [Variovorax sp. tm]|jgi:hypothetical protein|uniref:hypothetical protein n=1 Tax=Variovorax atrisoli TaxID=3394203 RepID=UPI00277FE075|nr:hypothetical protein [Variovorax paradoxus]